MVTAADVRDLVDERPDLEAAIREVLDAEEPFTFGDLAIDSGRFGEIVAADIVETTQAGDYRVADRAAVRRGLAGNIDPVDDGESTAVTLPSVADRAVALDRRVLAALAGALAVVVAVRLIAYPSVFRDGVVVLSGNDPYYYRYWVEQLVTTGTTAGDLPRALARGEPLMVTTLAAVARLLGGTVPAVSGTLAWYPVASAVLLAILLYALTYRVTDDRRIALAAVLLLAVVPAHAFRTGVGFADHHAFDYPWLGVTALALVALADGYPTAVDELDAGAVGWTLTVAVGVAGQTLAWDSGPLLLLPVGLYAAGRAIVDVAADRSPGLALAPVGVGVTLGAGLGWLAHRTLGWHSNLVIGAPALLAAGIIAVAVAGEVGHRLDLSVRVFAGLEVAGGVAAVGGIAILFPTQWTTAIERVNRSLLRGDNIAEVQSLFGDSIGWLLLFGFVLVLAVPYASWGTARARRAVRWAVPAAYFWVFLLLAAIQVRFAGQLAAFAALFAGLGFVHLAERVDLTARPRPFRAAADGGAPAGGDWVPTRPDRDTIALLVVLFLLVGGLGVVQSGVKTSQVTIDDDKYQTAAYLGEHAPDDAYVFSQWSWNRLYNYFVSGDAQSYSYARANYVPFVSATNETRWYDRLAGRVDYVVTTDLDYDDEMLGARLHRAHGSRQGDVPGLAHHRAVYVSPDGNHKVFAVVPGATIVGNASAGETVTVRTDVDVQGASFTYERQVTANQNGRYAVTVPYPGTYEVADEQVSVPDQAVTNGTQVRVDG